MHTHFANTIVFFSSYLFIIQRIIINFIILTVFSFHLFSLSRTRINALTPMTRKFWWQLNSIGIIHTRLIHFPWTSKEFPPGKNMQCHQIGPSASHFYENGRAIITQIIIFFFYIITDNRWIELFIVRIYIVNWLMTVQNWQFLLFTTSIYLKKKNSILYHIKPRSFNM